MIPLRRGSAAKKHAERAAWLTAHPEYAVGVPSESDDVTVEGRAALEALRIRMVDRDLFGHSSAQAQRDTIRRLVGDLRGVRKVVHW